MTRLDRETRDRLGLGPEDCDPYVATDRWFTTRPKDRRNQRYLIFVSPEGDTLPDAIAVLVPDPENWTVRCVTEQDTGWDVWVLEPLACP